MLLMKSIAQLHGVVQLRSAQQLSARVMRDRRWSARTDLALLERLVDLVQRAPEADVGAHLVQRGAQRGERT